MTQEERWRLLGCESLLSAVIEIAYADDLELYKKTRNFCEAHLHKRLFAIVRRNDY